MQGMKGTYRYRSLDVADDSMGRKGNPSRKFGTSVSWEDCPFDVFVNKWLPEFDKQNAKRKEDKDKELHRTMQTPVKPEAKQTPRRPVIADKPKAPARGIAAIKPPKSDRYHQITELLKRGPLTVGELNKELQLGSTSTAQKILKANPDVFMVVGEKPVGKNPFTKVWGLVNEGKKA